MLLALAVLALAAGARCAAVPPEATEAVAVATPATPAAEEQYGATPTAISEEASLRGVDADPQPQPPPAVRAPPNNSVPSASRRPCVCDDGQCSCCSGFVMQALANFAPRQRGCLNVTYDPDDFAFAMALSFNDRVLYKNTVSAKNPRPVCVALPRVTGAKMCVRLYNVYFVGRNVHACFDMEAKWQDTQAFQMSFDCIRVGADGVKVVKPEAGAGLAVGVPVGATPAPDEYDEIPAEHPPEKPDGSSSSSSSSSKPARERLGNWVGHEGTILGV